MNFAPAETLQTNKIDFFRNVWKGESENQEPETFSTPHVLVHHI